MRIGEIARNLSLAAVLASNCAPRAEATNPPATFVSSPVATERMSVGSEQERNTQIAREYLEALFSRDLDRVIALSHPEVRDIFNRTSMGEKELFRRKLDVFITCYRDYRLTNIKRTKIVEDREWRTVHFQFDPPCIMGTPSGGQKKEAMNVTLKRTPDGKYAPYNFSETFSEWPRD